VANDRVLLVGDRRQHEAVEAGWPFAPLQDAGMKTVRLEDIVRQKDPELRQVVEQLARGEVREAVQNLERQGRVHEIQGHDEHIAAIAKEYAKSPDDFSRQSLSHGDQRARPCGIAAEWPRQQRGVPHQDAGAASEPHWGGPHMGRALSGGGRTALLARIEGDWHRERRVRTGEERRRSEKPADSRAAGWHAAHLRSTVLGKQLRTQTAQ